MKIVFFSWILLLCISTLGMAKDRTYIRVQSTEYPPSKNVVVILSPFLYQYRYEEIGKIKVDLSETEELIANPTEEILQRLMREAALRGANAITKLQIGSYVVVEHLHQKDIAERRHTIYGEALAIKILPPKKKK